MISVILCVGVKAQLVQQSGDSVRSRIRERELQQEVSIGSCYSLSGL